MKAMKKVIWVFVGAVVGILVACSGSSSADTGLTQSKVQTMITAAVSPLAKEVATLQAEHKAASDLKTYAPFDPYAYVDAMSVHQDPKGSAVQVQDEKALAQEEVMDWRSASALIMSAELPGYQKVANLDTANACRELWEGSVQHGGTSARVPMPKVCDNY